MNMFEILPMSLEIMQWLGKHVPWIILENNPIDQEFRSNVIVDWDKLYLQAGHEAPVAFLKNIKRHGWGTLLLLEFVAQSYKIGPKIFVPSAEQFDAMQHVDIHIPIADFATPYPAMVVKIPVESRRSLAESCGLDVKTCPTWVVVYNRKTKEGRNAVFMLGHFSDDNDIIYFFQDRPNGFVDVETALQKWVLDNKSQPAQHLFMQQAGRAALNLMLLLTNYGCKDGSPLHPHEWVKHRKNKRHDLAKADFQTVELSQEIVVRSYEPRSKREEGEPSGVEMKPHWRRGHWRNQRVGEGLTQVKRLLVRPAFIRPDRAIGPLSDTTVVYRSV